VTEIFSHVTTTRPTHRRREVLSLEGMTALAACCTPRVGALIAFLWWSACRIGEAAGIRVTDCTDTQGGAVDIYVTGKGRAHRTEIPRAVFEWVRDIYAGKVYLFEKRTGGAATPRALGDEVRRQTQRAGHRVSPHELRHARASDLLHRNVNINQVSEFLGHSDASVTARTYLHSTRPTVKKQGQARAEEALERLDRLHAAHQQARSPWRRHTRPTARGSSRKAPP
jgi:integrase